MLSDAEVTPLTPSYAHVVLSCEWEISIERDSGFGTEQKIDGDDWRRLETMETLERMETMGDD
jgi:hypothetical protein